MCGRFVLISNLGKIADEFDLAEATPSSVPMGDIHPGQSAACVIRKDGKNHLSILPWGFLTQWTKQAVRSKLLINARAETLSEKPTFREAFQKRRCLIIADGFYEWSKEKKPFYFYQQNGQPFGLAGLYQTELVSTGGKEPFVIITTTPNGLIAPVHNRMPVIIPRDKQSLWLDNGKCEKSKLQSLMIPHPAKEMEMRPAIFAPMIHKSEV